ncbi:hypothetical protein F5B21DRAFT_507406 [Xylaria acuta]|nr:hypothetical protein F5B21DRAFT_507406 [Xylaria acuta]
MKAHHYVEAHSQNYIFQNCHGERDKFHRGVAFYRKWGVVGIWNRELGFARRKTRPSNGFLFDRALAVRAHGSPSPEPDDLTPLDKNIYWQEAHAKELELTPSEVGKPEFIDRPKSKQPERFWVVEKGDELPYLTGQMADNEVDMRQRLGAKLDRRKAKDEREKAKYECRRK